MGLDMYVRKMPTTPATQVQVDAKFDEQSEELFYWRKHHDLHGWMERLYRAKGGQDAEFNCNSVRLLECDLDALEQDIKEGKLPPTTGFFFGNNPPDAESQAEDLRFVAEARAAIAAGLTVHYHSWW